MPPIIKVRTRVPRPQSGGRLRRHPGAPHALMVPDDVWRVYKAICGGCNPGPVMRQVLYDGLEAYDDHDMDDDTPDYDREDDTDDIFPDLDLADAIISRRGGFFGFPDAEPNKKAYRCLICQEKSSNCRQLQPGEGRFIRLMDFNHKFWPATTCKPHAATICELYRMTCVQQKNSQASQS